MAPVVRPATIDDLAGILAIYNDAVQRTTAIWNETVVDLANRQDWYAARIADGFPVIVAAAENDILGYATYGSFRPHEGYRHTVENSIYIREDQRGKGIGTALMPPLIETARKAKLHAIVAAIEARNETSIHLHARFGFREVGRMPEVGRKFDRWLDLVLMQLLLES